MTSMKVLLIGNRGNLAQAFARGCTERNVPYETLDETLLDETPSTALDAVLERTQPTVCVYAAQLATPVEGEEDSVDAWRTHCVRPVRIAEACAKRHIALVTFSSDHVFDGNASEPYLESTPTSPATARGRAEAAGEIAVLQAHRGAIVVRMAASLDPWSASDFVSATLTLAARGQTVTVSADQVTSPTYLPDLVNTVFELVERGANGVWHVANAGETSMYQLARTACTMASLDPELVREQPSCPPPERKLSFTALRSGRGCSLPPLEDALARFMRARGAPSIGVRT